MGRTNSATLIPPDSTPIPRDVAPIESAPHPERSRNASVALIAIWGLGAVTLLIRLFVALFRLSRLEAQSREAMLGGVSVRVSEQVQTPLTWGICRHVILLPAALLLGDRAVCDSALRHEQAHIARGDWMWNLLAELVCACCWFQPGVWWLRARMRLESERACDDRVLLSGIAGPDYAAHILEIVRTVSTREVAPAMAQSRGMEERMRHILDGAKSRHAQTKWLAFSALFALALLSLAALRVAARPTEVRLQTDKGAATVNPEIDPHRSSPRHSEVAEPVEKPASTDRTERPQVNVSPAFRLESVSWGKAVGGLEPGFLLKTSGLPNPRVPFNSKISFQVLVRNTSNRARAIQVRCLNTDDMDIPYLIPGDAIQAALRGAKIPEKFRAKWTSSPLSGLFPAYVVTLAPGEAVVVPGEFELYIGAAQDQAFPRIEDVKMGTNWIVQPITLHSLTLAEATRAQAAPSNVTQTVTVATRAGKVSQRSATTVPAQDSGTKLYAKMQLEVGAPGVAAVGRR